MVCDDTSPCATAGVARAARAECRLLLDAALNGFLISRNGVIVEVSPSLVTAFGYAAEDLIGRPVTDFVAEECRETIRQKQADGVDGRSETVGLRKDGRPLHLEVVTRTVATGAGPARISVWRDISQRQQAHDALRDSERRLRLIARLARVGYWDDDVERNRLSWSEETCDVLGVPLTERMRPWHEFKQLVHPDDRSTVDAARSRVLGGESGLQVTFRTLTADGRMRRLEIIAEAIRDARGHITHVVGAIQDVSDREKAAAVLRGNEERFQLALHATGLGPWDWDLTTNEVEFWPEWKRQLGYEPDEIPNRYEEWESRLHPDDRERVLEALRGYLDGRLPVYALEFRLRHKDGSYRWIYTRGVIMRDAGGRQTHMIGCHLDITERRQLEDQYRQSQKMQAVGQLAGGIAHDFNNLLVVIGGYADLVFEELGPAHPSRRDLEAVRAATTSAASLTRQLLAFSRRQILQPQVLGLNHVLRRMQQMLGRVIGENIMLVMNLSSIERVFADTGQIEQVIMNLALNARDAMPMGGRLLFETLDIELDAAYVAQHPGACAGRHVMLAVTDTGAGMDEPTRARVFEPFFTTKAPGHGTGLGLATVYGIVKQSGGSIWVDSELGKGSTFKIFLPVATTGTERLSPPALEAQDLHGAETVLVVEDQRDVRELIERALFRYGYRVVVALSESEAIAAARAHEPIDVMLTDVVLTGTSGREVARQVVAHRPSTRVLYMSGYTEEVIVQHGVLEPGLAFIQKPFTAEALARKIREVLAADRPPLV